MSEKVNLVDVDDSYCSSRSIPVIKQFPPPPQLIPELAVPVVPTTVPPEAGANVTLPPNPSNYPVIVIQPQNASCNSLDANGVAPPVYVTVNITNHTNSYAKNNRVTFCEDCCEDLFQNVCFFCCWSKGRGKVDADPTLEPLVQYPY